MVGIPNSGPPLMTTLRPSVPPLLQNNYPFSTVFILPSALARQSYRLIKFSLHNASDRYLAFRRASRRDPGNMNIPIHGKWGMTA
ncbi:hypothetical protein VTN00DRAFT_4971 [Thermoascus crustaceus]|uniref:uncharacterized protein n=1 Tax=Thermoascus crustaceus TaxID=5088 RepID=UPI0037434512